MENSTFIIKSLIVQNGILFLSLGIVAALWIRAAVRRNLKGLIVFSIWLALIYGFFNSPFFGFSAVTVSEDGLRLNYGCLSLRNTVLPLNSRWEIETYYGGIRRNKKLFYLTVGGHDSMKVGGRDGLELLEKIGAEINAQRKAARIFSFRSSVPFP